MLWVAVVVMCLAVALLGDSVVALSIDVTTAVVLLIAGAVLGVVGVAVALHNIMSNVE